jgi:hypothetical protein
MRKYLTPEQIRQGTMHGTNKAFERYYQRQTEDSLPIFEKIKQVRGEKEGRRDLEGSPARKVLEFKGKDGAEGRT